MSANFDWQTEEDDRREHSGWDDPVETPPAAGRRRPWRALGLIGALVLAVGALLWWRASQRIEATTQAVQADVVASHNLVQRAIADGDTEVFRTFLSGRDPAWTESTVALVESGLFTDRTPFGLTPVEGSLPVILPAPDEETAAGARPATIELSPDLNEAVVTVAQPYRAGDGGTVVLQQQSVFRRGDQRWLLAPPVSDFWGEWLSAGGDYVRLIYTQRDAAIADRLAIDLNGAVARMCGTLADINCSADLLLTVRLDTDPQSLASLAGPVGPLRRAREDGNILELPTPSLVGLPAGDESEREAAYAALRDGYSRHVLSAVIARAVSWRCCDGAPLFALLLEYQLSELGLAPEPAVGPADYRRVLDERVTLQRPLLLTPGPQTEAMDPEWLWTARMAVDFLVNASNLPVAELQRRLSNVSTFSGYGLRALQDGAGDQPVPADITQAFWLHAMQRAAAAETEAPWPDESLYLSCTAPGETETSQLLRYQPEGDAWEPLRELRGYIWMTPLPGWETLLLQEYALATETWTTRLWHRGEIANLYGVNAPESALSLGQVDPTGRQLAIYHYLPAIGITRVLAADLDSCNDTGCATSPLPGQPVWSTDGAWTLYMGTNRVTPGPQVVTNGRHTILEVHEPFQPETIILAHGEDPGMPVGQGYAPFWIDEHTFGFIRPLAGSPPSRAGQEVVVATVDDPEAQTLVVSEDLYEFMPDEHGTRRLSLAYVAANPRRPDTLFIVALDRAAEEAHVFVFDRVTRRSEYRLTLPASFNHSLGFSPDGRYVVLTGDHPSNPLVSNLSILLLHEIDTNQTTPLLARLPYYLATATHDWTPDGRLIVALDDNLLGLIVPDTGQVRLLRHTAGACTSVAWLNE